MLMVGLVFVTDMIDSWRAVQLLMYEMKTMVSLEVITQAHNVHRRQNGWKPIMHLPDWVENNQFISIFNMGPHFKYLHKEYCYLLMLCIQHLFNTWISYNTEPLWLLQVEGYSAANDCMHGSSYHSCCFISTQPDSHYIRYMAASALQSTTLCTTEGNWLMCAW